jgi:hypothetical protein
VSSFDTLFIILIYYDLLKQHLKYARLRTTSALNIQIPAQSGVNDALLYRTVGWEGLKCIVPQLHQCSTKRKPEHNLYSNSGYQSDITMIPRLIASSTARPAVKRAASSALAKPTATTAANATRCGCRAFSSVSTTDATSSTLTLDDYEQIMGPAPKTWWLEEAVKSATEVCDLTGWSGPVVSSSTTMGLDSIFDTDGPPEDDQAYLAGYRTQCSFDTEVDETRPGVDSPANEV